MITTNSFFQPMDEISQRRRALGNVYEFLLKLAEKKESEQKTLKSDQETKSYSEPLQKNIS